MCLITGLVMVMLLAVRVSDGDWLLPGCYLVAAMAHCKNLECLQVPFQTAKLAVASSQAVGVSGEQRQ